MLQHNQDINEQQQKPIDNKLVSPENNQQIAVVDAKAPQSEGYNQIKPPANPGMGDDLNKQQHVAQSDTGNIKVKESNAQNKVDEVRGENKDLRLKRSIDNILNSLDEKMPEKKKETLKQEDKGQIKLSDKEKMKTVDGKKYSKPVHNESKVVRSQVKTGANDEMKRRLLSDHVLHDTVIKSR